MPYYEAMIIVRPDAETELVDSIIERIEGLVRQDEGIVLDCEVLGRKRLAYEVQKCHEGIYVKINFEAPTKVVDVLKHYMQLSEDVIRHMIVRTKTYVPMDEPPIAEPSRDADDDDIRRPADVDDVIVEETVEKPVEEPTEDEPEPEEEKPAVDAEVAEKPAVDAEVADEPAAEESAEADEE